MKRKAFRFLKVNGSIIFGKKGHGMLNFPLKLFKELLFPLELDNIFNLKIIIFYLLNANNENFTIKSHFFLTVENIEIQFKLFKQTKITKKLE